jgi:hypothetical protein
MTAAVIYFCLKHYTLHWIAPELNAAAAILCEISMHTLSSLSLRLTGWLPLMLMLGGKSFPTAELCGRTSLVVARNPIVSLLVAKEIIFSVKRD